MAHMEAIEEGFKILTEAPFHNKSALDRARGLWSINTARCLDRFVLLLKSTDWENSSEAELCAKVAIALSSSKISIPSDSIADKSDEIIGVIDALLARGEFDIISDPKSTFSSIDLVIALCELYFYHCHRNKQHSALIAPTVVKIVELYSNVDCSLALECISCHSEAEDLYARIIYACILNRDVHRHCSSINHIAKEMLADGEYKDFLYNNSLGVFNRLIAFKNDWETSELSYLLETLFIYPLGLEMRDRAKLIASYNKLATVVKNKFDKQYYREQAEYIENNYEEFVSLNRQKAARKLATSRKFYNLACVVALKYASINEKAQMLSELLLEAEQFIKSPKKFDIKSKPTNKFKDFGLKLLVIEELMYRQNSLLPRFSLREFAKEYCGGEIEVNDDGVIPQVIDYYKTLDIAGSDLERVHELWQDNGCDGGAEVYHNINPYWDPGCGDTIFKVEDTAVTDLRLLPNLKLIYTTDIEDLSPAFIAAAEKQGVKIVEDASWK